MNHKTNVENVCLDCLRIFKNVAALSNHIKSCDGNITHQENYNETEVRRSNRMTSSANDGSNTSASNITGTTTRKSCQYCDEFVFNDLPRHEQQCRRKICPKCSRVFTTTRNTLRHLINIHRVPKNKVHSLWTDPVPINDDSKNNFTNELDDEEDDEDVVLSVDCCTLEEIPLKRQRMA